MNDIRQMSPAAVRERLRTDGGQLLDVREAWERERACLPGTLHVPLAELPSRLRALNPNESFIVYCHHGVRSWHAACFMKASGFKDVSNLAGGIDAWSREVDPEIPRY